MRHPSLVPVLLALIAAMILSSGCAEETVEESGPVMTSAAEVATTPAVDEIEVMPAAVAEDNNEAPAEADVPEIAGSAGPQSDGEYLDGLRLDDVRWDDKGSYFRVVFDLTYTSGESIIAPPHADAIISPDGTAIEVTLGGIRGISEQPNVIEQQLVISDDLVESIERLAAMDDQALVYRISLSAPATYTLDSLGDPGRVVVDIYP